MPESHDLADLFANLPDLWERATVDERRQLVQPLIERVYVDLDTRLIGALVHRTASRP